MKNLFIGIDFSKQTLDVSMFASGDLSLVHYQCFDNDKRGCASMLKWVGSKTCYPEEQWLFCGEDTGLYSVELATFLSEKGLFLWLENALQIKRSTGIKRDKTDKIDSLSIAKYAYRFQDRAKAYQLPEESLTSLSLLLSFRERLVRNKHSLMVASREIRKVYQRNATARHIYEQSEKDVERINKEIEAIEKKMKEIIGSCTSLQSNYTLVTSIKGVALINTVAILVCTKNFSRFSNARQFACYAGLAPFGKQSGTSIKTAPHVSPLANKQIKALLSHAAQAAIRHDSNIRSYYERKIAEGKPPLVVINNVKNKIVHRMFAILRSRIPYRVDYENQRSINLA
jgi:transposase